MLVVRSLSIVQNRMLLCLVRPGPIQGDMVHPYLRRRRGEEPIDYPPRLKHVFERTLGVPLFQEQVMQVAVDAAGFTPGEADQLRRSMAAWKRRGGLEPHREKLLAGMLTRGYSREYAEQTFERIKGFGSYGFPESHAASFALVTYASCWLKCHEPEAFAVSLINSQPMGFYTPDQILQDVRRTGVRVLPVDVRYSDWDCTLEFADGNTRSKPAIRLGLRLVNGFSEPVAEHIATARTSRALPTSPISATEPTSTAGTRHCSPSPARSRPSAATATAPAGPSPASRPRCHCSRACRTPPSLTWPSRCPAWARTWPPTTRPSASPWAGTR